MSRSNRIFLSTYFLLLLWACIPYISEISIYLPAKLSIWVDPPRTGVYEVFFGGEQGLSSVRKALNKDEGVVKIDFSLPPKRIQTLRIDPGDQEGRIRFEKICMETPVDKQCWGPKEILSEFKPLNGISEYKIEDGALILESTGIDPFFAYDGDLYESIEIKKSLDIGKSYLYGIALALTTLVFFLINPTIGMIRFFRRKPSQMKRFLLVFLFTLSIVFSLSFFQEIDLEFSNPWRITGPLTAEKYNPTTDIARFLFFLSTPFLFLFIGAGVLRLVSMNRLYAGLRWFLIDRISTKLKHRLIKGFMLLVFISTLVVVGGSFYICHDATHPPLDTFHEGESLGPAIDYLHGKVPYRDTIFVHGPFKDPLRSVLAFKLFGRSIASVRTLFSITEILTLFVFGFSLYFIFDKNLYHSSLALSILLVFLFVKPFGAGFTLANRDIPLYILLICAAVLHGYLTDADKKPDARTRHDFSIKIGSLLFFMSFVPIFSFAYSIDRGFYLTAASIIILSPIYLLVLRRMDNRYLFPILLGYLLGIMGLGFAIRWAYADFFHFSFLVMPKYKELMDGLIYRFDKTESLIPVVLIAGNLYWVGFRFLLSLQESGTISIKIKRFLLNYFIETLLLFLSIFYFRSALGRSDQGHIQYVLSPAYILSTYILIRHYVGPLIRQRIDSSFFRAAICLSLIPIFLLLNLPRVSWSQWYRFPLGTPDEEIIPANYKGTIRFLQSDLEEDEDFFTLNSEAIWYYFLDKSCPARFQVVWFAMPPFYQKEIVEDLKRANVKYILYRNDSWTSKIDGFDNTVRLPILMEYIHSHYEFFKKIDDNEIWIRKSMSSSLTGTEGYTFLNVSKGY